MPLKTLVPPAARLWLKQVRQESWCRPTVRFPAGKKHNKQYPVKVTPSDKTGQLSCLASTYFSQQSRKQEAMTVHVLGVVRGSNGLLPGHACL